MKLLFVMFTRHRQVPGINSSNFTILTQLPANVSDSQQRTAQIRGFLPTMWETRTEPLPSALAWASLNCCGHLGREEAERDAFVTLLFK